MRLPGWLGVQERRWKKSPDEDVQPAKTVWDVLQLLIVPVLLVLIALYFNSSQASRDRSREDRQARQDRALAEDAREDATLDAYIAKMSSLILDRGLLKSGEWSAVRQVARTATLATVRRLSPARKGEVVRFLYEAGLLRARQIGEYAYSGPVINLTGADLRGADLVRVTLAANSRGQTQGDQSFDSVEALWGDLRGARFVHADLDGVDFRGARLRGASFKDAFLFSTSFYGAKLFDASFERARLDVVEFQYALLDGAVFDHARVSSQTSFAAAQMNRTSFVRTTFQGGPNFKCAEGRGVDFSYAVNLSSLRVRYGVFTDVRMDGVKGRPHGWGPTGTLHREETKSDDDCFGPSRLPP
jgi:uncharacterized protein YjbI with pentapeptide repeats